jgi:hypothetical protein
MKKLIFLLVLGLSVGPTGALAQSGSTVTGDKTDEQQRFSARCTFTGAASTVYCALSVSGNASKRTFVETVVVYSPTTSTLTFDWGGTTPSGTAIASSAYHKRNTSTTSEAVVYTNASTTGAAEQSRDYPITAAVPSPYTFSGHAWPSGLQTNRTLLVKISGVTGSGWVDFYWGQK